MLKIRRSHEEGYKAIKYKNGLYRNSDTTLHHNISKLKDCVTAWRHYIYIQEEGVPKILVYNSRKSDILRTRLNSSGTDSTYRSNKEHDNIITTQILGPIDFEKLPPYLSITYVF